MRQLPLADPGVPDTRSPGRLLWWIARGQWHTLMVAMSFGIVWMLAQAVTPALVGRAIDEGVAGDDTSRLLLWAGALLGIGVVGAVAGVFRHRFSVTNWLTAAYRTVQLVVRRSTDVGAALPQQVPTGEVVSIGATDLAHIGGLMDIAGRMAGAVVSFVVVAVILLDASRTLGLVVLIGVPLLLLAIGPLLRPLQARTLSQRELTGRLNGQAADIVGGLRVLRGIGGERVFHDRYSRESQRVRSAGVQVARLQSVLDALQVLLPGMFVVLVVWLGARLAVQGEISVGELVAFYGYAAFLMMPLRTSTEFANKLIRARVAAARVCRLLAGRADARGPGRPAAAAPRRRAGRRDVRPGRAPGADDRRRGRHPGGVGTPGRPARPVRRRRRDVRRGAADRRDPARRARAGAGQRHQQRVVRRPDARRRRRAAERPTTQRSPVSSTPHRPTTCWRRRSDGWDTEIEERGRSLSGGQRQRLVLARALLADPDVLVLVEPTSAVDAHTEARIAARLRDHRAGRTTVVTTTSPLLLDRVDEVAFLVDGVVAATGAHRGLLETDPRYRAVVTRGEDA